MATARNAVGDHRDRRPRLDRGDGRTRPDLFERIVAGPLLAADEPPRPCDAQRKPPTRDEDDEKPVQPGLQGL
ncbi:MAG: hypothetical protein M3485_06330 [Pseudomonadota bacterium]|nr:hypothetical protein [Pseudomonadota bacterium]